MPYPHILTAPYGTNLEAGTTRCISNGEYREQIGDIAQGSFRTGSTTLATDTFPLGGSVGFDAKNFTDQLEAHHAFARGIITNNRLLCVKLLLSLRPANDCYLPEKAPDTPLATDFHGKRLDCLPAGFDDMPQPEILMETFCSAGEALGAALAYAEMQRRLSKAKRDKTPLTLCFVVDEAGSLFDGTPVHEVIKMIRSIPGTESIGFGINCSSLPGTARALKLAQKHGVSQYLTTIYPNATDQDVRILDGSDAVVQATNLRERAKRILTLAHRYPSIHTVGGCCGWDPQSLRWFRCDNHINQPKMGRRTAA